MDDLHKLRQDIDRIDHDIVQLLADRMSVIKKVGEYKKKHNIPPLDLQRWEHVLEEKIKLAEKHGISTEFIKKLYNTIHDHALELEEKIRK